ncbi:MAG: hypothetical protein HY910_11400 [Desulfarculus sp.]|nr:hypothetical protein [Desulfarculus sp.]
MSLPARHDGLAGLLRRAAHQGGSSPAARAAQKDLHALRLASPQALGRMLAALAMAPPGVVEAAADWLFQAEPDWELGLELAGQAGSLLDLVAQRPGPWWSPGLAGVLALAGRRPLARLLALAKEQPWAREVVTHLPPDYGLPGGHVPAVWLARRELGRSGQARVRRRLARRDWPALAGLGAAAMVLGQALAGYSPAAAGAAPLAWPGGDLALLEEMAALTAREGLAAADLAVKASLATGRLVILLGNASLGGPPLWAMPGPWQPGVAMPTLAAPRPSREIAQLARLRAARLGGPALLQALWEARAGVALHGRGRAALERLLAQAGRWLPQENIEGLRAGRLTLALAGRPPGPALAVARAALAQARALEREGRAALTLVAGLARALGRPRGGQALVLPYADKFAASTAKGGDHAYLAGLAGLLAGGPSPPLLLLMDETPHPATASLGRILEEASRLCPGLALRGLGAFAGQAEPSDLEAALIAAARDAHLVGFRPLPGSGPWPGLEERLAGRGQGLPLAPVSRDGAAWLLAGTRLAGLSQAGPPLGQEEPAPWLLTGAGFAPLGAWFRRRIMTLAGAAQAPPGPWRRYQRLCNLE